MKVLVIGDSCIDKFIYCDISRICPEAPVPVMNPIYSEENSGMAANVTRNLKSLGINVDFITNNETITKTRYVDNRSGQMVIRVDENDKCKNILKKELIDLPWEIYDAVVISDYCKGFLSEENIWFISQKHPLTFLDTKKQLGDWANNISFIKINEFEHKKNFESLPNYPNLNDKLIVTMGNLGSKYKDKLFPVLKVSVKDVSGAGDTFLSGLVSEYIKTQNISKSIKFANKCATIVVQQRGVVSV